MFKSQKHLLNWTQFGQGYILNYNEIRLKLANASQS